MAGGIAFLGLIVLTIVVYGMRTRLSELERRIADLERPVVEAPAAPRLAPKAEPQTAAKSAESPWIAAKSAAGAAPETPSAVVPRNQRPDEKPRSFVFRAETLEATVAWLRANWFLAIAALSLALAGVFLVQYGVEHGVITPFWRVISAAVLGITLIWLGEFVRRHAGDGRAATTAYLPSTFSGSGLVALFAAVLAAQHLYGLITPASALIWLIGVAIVAVVLGWFYGPFLTVVGILGSTAAPFLVGGESETPQLIFYYFALIAAAGLAVDALKRWAWVSAFALIFTFTAAWILFAGGGGDAHYLAFAMITTALAVTVPPLSLLPSHQGPPVLGTILSLATTLRTEKPVWSGFPTRLAFATFAAASAAALMVALKDSGPVASWLAIAALGFLYIAATVWLQSAPALDDLALIPPALILLIAADQALSNGSIFSAFTNPIHLEPEAARPTEATVLAAMALVGSALAHWRGLFPGPRAALWSAGAALLAPLALILLELTWDPTRMLGAGWWSGLAMIVAAAMVLFASQTARRDGEDRRRTALYALAALTMISMALILVLSATSLTLAIGGMVLGAAIIDQRLNLRPVTLLVHAGASVIAWRLLFDPGLLWAGDAPLWEVLLAYLGSAALLAAAAFTLRVRDRVDAETTAESGAMVALALLANVLIYKAMGPDAEGHAALSLQGLVWLISMANQIYRLKSVSALRWVRIVLAILFGLVALVLIGMAATFTSPLTYYNPVAGPLILDSLLVAYLLPALPLALIAASFTHLQEPLRIASGILASCFGALYVGLEIRRFWQGRDLSAPRILEGELYSYTLALLVSSVVLLFIAFWHRSNLLRQVAVTGVTVTIAKVFLIDMSGLAGLYRVASFLGLGLSLASLAWIVRRMAAQWDAASRPK